MSAYVRSKAIAERAAWDFMAAEGGALELAVVNPAGIFGPVLGADFSSSIQIVTRLMNGVPGCPQLYFGVVDVRDVADLHLRAMTHPAAKGERFIAVSGDIMSMLEIATRAQGAPGRRGEEGADAGAAELAGAVSPRCSIARMRPLLPLLDNTRRATSAKAERVLGWKPRSREDAIVATAESLVKFGIVGGNVDEPLRRQRGPEGGPYIITLHLALTPGTRLGVYEVTAWQYASVIAGLHAYDLPSSRPRLALHRRLLNAMKWTGRSSSAPCLRCLRVDFRCPAAGIGAARRADGSWTPSDCRSHARGADD